MIAKMHSLKDKIYGSSLAPKPKGNTSLVAQVVGEAKRVIKKLKGKK